MLPECNVTHTTGPSPLPLPFCPLPPPPQVFNISGERYVTFDGIARACAKAMGAPEPELVHFNAKDFDFGKKKVRIQEFVNVENRAVCEQGCTPTWCVVLVCMRVGLRRGGHAVELAAELAAFQGRNKDSQMSL